MPLDRDPLWVIQAAERDEDHPIGLEGQGAAAGAEKAPDDAGGGLVAVRFLAQPFEFPARKLDETHERRA